MWLNFDAVFQIKHTTVLVLNERANSSLFLQRLIVRNAIVMLVMQLRLYPQLMLYKCVHNYQRRQKQPRELAQIQRSLLSALSRSQLEYHQHHTCHQ